ncbi:MAG: nucleotide excision repair endonuclease [Vicinamibacterales bacterium]
MLLRDKLLAQLAAMGAEPDYPRLAADVLGIRNAPPALARRLVEQALVVEDRREVWLRTGERICAEAPDAPGVYLLRDAQGSVLYVGKANNIRRRLRTHFAARRWHMLKPEFARASRAEWMIVGSEIEALLREAIWIRECAPKANVQVGAPSLDARAVPATLLRDTLVLLPSVDEGAVELLAVRVAGPVLLVRIQRDGTGLPARIKTVRQFFAASDDDAERVKGCAGPFAPLVFTWLNGRGAAATRLDPHDAGSARELQRRVKLLVDDERLFAERIVVLRSGFRSTLARALSSVG